MTSRKGRLSRRGFLLASLGAGLAANAGCAAPPTRAVGNTSTQAPPASLNQPDAPDEPVTTEQVHSPARDANVELVTIRPEGVGGRLPVCVALHGRGGNARTFLDLGIPDLLNKAVAAGVKPFAVVSVDGGDSYWVGRKSSDDPQKMLFDDLPTWLANRGFATDPFAAIGISMGGYGALNFARTPGIATVAAISSALFTSWPDAKIRNAFAGEAAWEATEPLRHTNTFGNVTLGVWCGTSDPFIAANRQLVTKARPKVAAIGPGDHTNAYWQKVLPDVLRFIGDSVP